MILFLFKVSEELEISEIQHYVEFYFEVIWSNTCVLRINKKLYRMYNYIFVVKLGVNKTNFTNNHKEDNSNFKKFTQKPRSSRTKFSRNCQKYFAKF